jgi:hypothetical protein
VGVDSQGPPGLPKAVEVVVWGLSWCLIRSSDQRHCGQGFAGVMVPDITYTVPVLCSTPASVRRQGCRPSIDHSVYIPTGALHASVNFRAIPSCTCACVARAPVWQHMALSCGSTAPAQHATAHRLRALGPSQCKGCTVFCCWVCQTRSALSMSEWATGSSDSALVAQHALQLRGRHWLKHWRLVLAA